MPITQSAKKALRQNRKKRTVNEAQKRTLRAVIKKFIKNPNTEGLPSVYQKLDKAAKTNLIKKNRASRLKSRLTHLITRSSKATS